MLGQAVESRKNMYRMKSWKRPVALGLVLAFGAGQQAWAAQQQEDDSVYRWGRWAVLSPAAGGDSYKGQVTPDATNNARPSDASAFQPVVAGVGVAPVEPPVALLPPTVQPNPPGASPPIGDGRVRPIVTTPNPPNTTPPIGDGRQR